MDNFYEHLSPEDVQVLDSLSVLLIELRESRDALLEYYGVDGEDTLLEKIRSGEIGEHPAYEAYLGAKSIQTIREAIRKELKNYMLEI